MAGNFELGESLREIDNDGRLRVKSSNISKETVNPYYGYEIPNYENLGLDKNKIYKLYRPGTELQKAADSFNGIQIISKHTPLSADAPEKDLVVGTTGTDCVFEAPYLKNSLFFWDSQAIGSIQAADEKNGGMKELSCGYAFDAVMTPGEFDGDKYDGMMTNIVGNHVAVVEHGRAGSDVKVSDINPFINERTMKKNKMKDRAMKKIKAMDMEMSPERLDTLVDALLGVEEGSNNSSENENNPEPEVMDDATNGKEKARQMLKAKGFSDEEVASLEKMFSSSEAAEDEDKTDKDDDKEDKTNDEEQSAMNKKADCYDEEESVKKEDVKKAMDELEGKLRKQYKDLEEAKQFVRAIVGDIALADSAEDVYRFALDELKVAHSEIKEVAALKALIKIKNEAKNSFSHETSGIAQDSASFVSKFPNMSRVYVS